MDKNIRRYDLDWLRVIVFGLLIFYHVGMFFVPWGWHIKNNEISEGMRWPMLFLNQWRLPILFVISGMGTYYALSKRSIWKFNLERCLRLGVPLIFGMLVIVPPQIYFERLVTNQFIGSYFSYITTEAFIGVYPEGNVSWHHLWFLPYLLIFSITLSPLFVRLKRNSSRSINWIQRQIQKPYGLFLFIVPLYFIEALIEPFFPVTHALIDDWFNFINSITFFLFGFILIATGKIFWESIERIKSKALIIGVIAFSIQLFIWVQGKDSFLIHFTEALVKVTNLWSWILVLFGYSSSYLNSNNKILSYCNRAVYPFYILHQTITIIIGYYLMNLEWSIVTKFIIMILGTFLGSWVIYHFLILKIPLLQPLFGLKKNKY
ncbi:Surface polysaccharide O-acyltransferase, integral membrane enzyme [Aquimarina amphilecti]|uniref:Surface polysaccharide O-acyltransferase, integral membrane enzyme n=1 Tax=Aquimarina amphilecti TaxID=1038014 RepID=A0A1H7L2F0_AQUAM|nr:acyltransferase family protein [Aquimarina amphilecti]SEK93168.1 Surface polysaccharide O-acyltransferase, integral membrane enzyme [Aquimarina amphilecti]